MLANEREMQLKRNCREEIPHDRVVVVVVVDCRERRNRTRGTVVVDINSREEKFGCFDASLAVTNLGFHVDLVWREKSHAILYLATRVNNMSYECYVIFIT